MNTTYDPWRLIDDIVTYQRASGVVTAVITTATTAYEIATRHLGDDHPILRSRNNLAGAYQAAGDLGRAIPLFEANLADSQRVLGDHPDTVTSRNNLAAGLRQAHGDDSPGEG